MGLSWRHRSIRGKRSAMPDLCLVDLLIPSKANSKTCTGGTVRTGPKRSRVFLRTQAVIFRNSASVIPE